jgi:hypothetical protein
MDHVDLHALDATELFDVFHYLYESYIIASSLEHLDLQTKIRSAISENLYERPYRYAMRQNTADGSQTTASGDPMTGTPPADLPTKSYIPPTDPGSLEAIVGRPAG